MPTVLAIDLGGTKVLAAIVSESGEVLATGRKRVPSECTWQAVLERIREAAERAVAEAGVDWTDLAAAGIGVPGPVDSARGVAFQLPNLGLKDVPVAETVRGIVGCPTTVCNDVDAGLMGEIWQGVAKGRRNAVGLFPGTGLGGAVYVDGQLVRGKTGITGEVGHMVIKPGGLLCGCGRRGCLEAYASRTAMEAWCRRKYAKGYHSTLEGLDKPGERIRSNAFLKAAQDGDDLALRCIRRTARYLGYAAANLILLLSPEIIVFGGGVIEAMEDYMMDTIREHARERCLPGCFDGIELAAARCGDNATVLGVAALTLRSLGVAAG